MDRRRDGKNYIFYNQKDTVDFYTRIKANDYTVLCTLKDDRRSLVQLIRINGKRYVLKVPREKNRRKWQRFLSIFRGEKVQESADSLKNLCLTAFMLQDLS